MRRPEAPAVFSPGEDLACIRNEPREISFDSLPLVGRSGQALRSA